MNFLNDIKDDTLLIIPTSIKDKILKEINKLKELKNIKILSFNELKRLLFFDYDIKAVLYLMSKYDMKQEVANKLINNMYYVENKMYKSEKLNKLKDLKEELANNKLLSVNPLFYQFYKDKSLVVFNHDYLDNFELKILSMFSNSKVISKEDKILLNKTVYEFNTVEEEVNYIINKIIDLINNGIDINKIKIANINDDYKKLLYKFSKLYKLPIYLDDKNSIISSIMVKGYINKLEETSSIIDSINYIKDNYNLEDSSNLELFNKIIGNCNKYIGCDYPTKYIIESLTKSLRDTYFEEVELLNKVSLVDINNNYFYNDEYVFLPSFNVGILPKTYKDEDYISDSLKGEVKLNLTSELNRLEKEAFINNICNIKNLIITYKLNDEKEEYFPSTLVNELGLTIVKGEVNTNVSYSSLYSQLTLSKMLDNLINYGELNDNLPVYYSSYDIPYLTYNNKFDGIDKDILMNKLHNKLILSYSSIDTYYRCGFRYYINNILKLSNYEETFQIYIGKLFHHVLSKIEDSNFDFNSEYDSYIKDRKFDSKEIFYIEKLKKELTIIIKRIKDLHNSSGLTNTMMEKEIHLDKSINNINVDFMGIFDKVMYKEVDGNNLVSIIDYKTGHPIINIYNSVYGIDMQLLVYLYLINKSNILENPKMVGIYLQQLLNNEVNISKDRTYLEEKYSDLKLQGYSIDDESLIERFDITYNNSEFIKSMRTSNKGFYNYTKVITEEEIASLIDLVNTKIEEARDNIVSAKFDINPKVVGTECIGCTYCTYKDLCYKKVEDNINLKEYKDLSFIGGDTNA